MDITMVECGILDLGSCLPQKLMEYLLTILNAPLQPFLTLVHHLLSEPIRLDLFSSLWAIIIYVLSMFYAFLIIYSGLQFITSGYDAHKRDKAKEWLKNIVIMIVLVQASFFIYQLFIDLSSVMTTATLSLIDTNFFLLTIDNITNLGLELLFGIMYALTLFITALILVVRYAIVAVGVVLFPLGIFCYFIEPLQPYGMLVLHFLGVSIFITFLDAILLIGFSQLTVLPIFDNFKILIMIAGFFTINIVMFFLMFFSIIKAGFSLGGKIALTIAKLA
ncbi:MAG: hypothetical protein Q7R87_04335 [Nanoarchaeota archaeon]|nr:hypothetical protein [Nanoarchaeota archaeon]